ncbi:hypothetical protein TCE0_018f05870 [Talaromyces pinophilus]|uniref:Cytochrome P450 n=1 Tax=Talaromyces pinophilus TaxID=128442 RepID=A0A510NX74_TALPI|nr:hypothetical protein TCE0_018f05870 [Talaromyces pinophilus]
MSTLTSYEPLVDRTILRLFQELDGRFKNTGLTCPIFSWLQYYAFDVIGEITCGQAFGFLEKGQDVDGIIEALNNVMDYNAIIGQIPWLDLWLEKNSVWVQLKQPTGAIAQFAHQQLAARLDGSKGALKETRSPQDFVDRFLHAKLTHPEVVDDKQVFSYMVTNIFAGSDTTAISLRAIVYYTLKHPDVYNKLITELTEAKKIGQLSMPTTWQESQNLQYFDAVVKEAMRLHPAVGLILERIVPSQGLELECGTRLPAGTIVGASPWVVHRDRAVFGDDPDHFRPERWLRSDREDAETYDGRLRAMTGATMTFGKGHRSCIGKNISLLEIYKMLPSFFLRYDVSAKCN